MKQNKVPKVEYHKGEPSDKKPSPYRYDRIVDETVVNDSMGYWNPDNFGKIVQFSAPDGRVSMNNVNFPVMAISNKGEYNMQMPGQEYQYKGDFITEYPMAKNGGWLDSLPMAQKGKIKTPEGWGKEIRAVEKRIGNPSTWTLDSYKTLQDKLNEYKTWRENTAEGKAVVDYHNEPNEYVVPLPEHLRNKKNGGGLLNKTLTCPSCGWSWKAVDGGKDIATCHKCGGTAKLAYGGDPSLANIEGHYPFGGQNSKTGTHFEEGGWLDKYQGDVDGSQVMPDEAVPGVNYFSLPEVSVYPKPEKTFWNKIQESDFIKQIVDRLDKSTGGKDWYKDPSKGMGSALAEVVSLPFAAPQLAATYGLTGKVQTPSEAMNIENPYGAFAVDAILDPTNLLGAGLADDALKLSSKAANFTRKGLPNGANAADNIVTQLRKELAEKGIVESQKTLNLPGKEAIRKGINPFGYDIKDKVEDIKSLFKNSPNPDYVGPKKLDKTYETYLKLRRPSDDLLSKEEYFKTISDSHFFKTRKEVVDNRFANRFSDDKDLATKNRHATWDMYLGKPQTEHPMYDISKLTKSKDDVVYTIKEDFMNKKQIEPRLNEYIDEIESLERRGQNRMKMIAADDMVKKGDSWIIPDSDKNLFGTMGGFHWKVDKMPDGNYKAMANDVWDLQPLKGNKKLPKAVQNIEVGKALGIGKPLNVKVGFILDGKTKKIVNTFGLAPAALAAGALQEEEDGGWLDQYQGKVGGNQVPKDRRQIPQSGMVIDKRTNEAYYFGDKGETGNFPVLTGLNPELNSNTYSPTFLHQNPQYKNTPVGYYIMETPLPKTPYTNTYYNGRIRPMQPISAFGMNAPDSEDLSIHNTFSDPTNPSAFKIRNKLYSAPGDKRYISQGCVNCKKESFDAFTNAVPKDDTLLILDSKKPMDLILLQQAQARMKKKQDGGWLDELDEEYRRGGQRRRRGTSKNIQSSINDLFRRNYDVYGPAGKNRYNPTAYKTGGWLDNVD